MRLRIFTPVVATVVLGSALHSPAPGLAGAGQEAPVVTIGLDDEGNITVSPDPVVVNRGETVEWVADPESAVESWTIRFRSPVPFGNAAAQQGINGNRGQRRGQALNAEAQVGRRYKYMVSVWDGQRVRILDPEIEVGPGQLASNRSRRNR